MKSYYIYYLAWLVKFPVFICRLIFGATIRCTDYTWSSSSWEAFIQLTTVKVHVYPIERSPDKYHILGLDKTEQEIIYWSKYKFIINVNLCTRDLILKFGFIPKTLSIKQLN